MESRKLISEGYSAQGLVHEPPDICLDDHIMDVKFSPNANVIALGQVTGDVRVYTYSEEQTKEVLTFNHHVDSCRRVEFSFDGNVIYTVSTDQSIGVLSNGRLEGKLTAAHDAPINSVIHLDAGHLIATGDDDGVIKVWDLRQAAMSKKGPVMAFEEHDGTISDMVVNGEKNMLLSSSNDGCLGVFDLRKPELYAMSDNFEEDLTAITLCKNERKVLVSSSEGIINIFSWDWFGDCNDRIIGHPNSIDTMIKYDEELVITGSEDGLLRAVSVLPNKIVAILGDPTDMEDELFHIQRVSLSHDKNFLASCSLDDIVKIIDVSHLQGRQKEFFDEVGYEKNLQSIPREKKAKAKKVESEDDLEEGKEEEKKGDQNMVEDEGNEQWDTDSEGDSDDSSSEEEEQSKNKKKNKQLNQKNMTAKRSQKLLEQAKKKQFFDDL